MELRARIHRGAREIGGSCVELEAGSQRLVLDVGLPLDAGFHSDVELPDIAGLHGDDPSLLGVVISHGHPDHWGLVDQLGAGVPVYVGAATDRLLAEAAFFAPTGMDLKAHRHLRDGETLRLGPFAVTPLLVDHSAFDAYALLIEAGSRRLFYSGDLRATGRKGRLFERLVADPPEAHAVLLEGTQVRPGRSRHSQLTEADVEDRCAELMSRTDGIVLAAYSSQNIDRLVTLYRAAVRSGRRIVLDLYGATLAAATESETIPQAEWSSVSVYVPVAQRVKVKQSAEFARVATIRASRIYPEDLAMQARELVLTFRQSMTRELDRAGCLGGAQAIWSMWDGYLDRPPGEELRGWLDLRGIPLTSIHASGHATVAHLQRLARALQPARIVPIHTDHPELFPGLFPRAELRGDGGWWKV